MTRRWAFGAAIALAMGAGGGPLVAVAQQAPEVGVQLVPDLVAVPRGSIVHVAVRLAIPSGWHLGWVNPGASGLPTSVAWQTGSGVRADSTVWPYPGVDSTDGVLANVYRDRVVSLTTFHVGSSVSVGPTGVRASLSWGICSTICIPQQRSAQLVLSVVTGPGQRAPRWNALASDLRRLPYRDSHVRARAALDGDTVRLHLDGVSRTTLRGASVTFFPSTPGGLPVAVTVHHLRCGLEISLPATALGDAGSLRLEGVLVTDGSWTPHGVRRALAVETSVTPDH